MGMVAILVMWPGQFIKTFIPPSQGCSMWSLTLNGQAVSKKKMFEHCERTTTTTDTGAWVYYKLTFWGELKTYGPGSDKRDLEGIKVKIKVFKKRKELASINISWTFEQDIFINNKDMSVRTLRM